jgi:hypothetical protein
LFPFAFASHAADEACEYSFGELGEDDTGAALLPVAINDAGDICATSHRAGGMAHGWTIRGATREAAGTAMCHGPAACLGSNGLLAGTSGATLGGLRAWAAHLGPFGERHWRGVTSFARGINARGEIVGDVLSDAGEFVLSRAFLRPASGSARFLTPPHGGTTFATAINDAGDIALNSTPLGAARDDSRAWLVREQCYIAHPSPAPPYTLLARLLSVADGSKTWTESYPVDGNDATKVAEQIHDKIFEHLPRKEREPRRDPGREKGRPPPPVPDPE